MRSTELLAKANEAARDAMAKGNPLATAVDAAVLVVVTDLHAMLYPEKHPGYDPDHIYWTRDAEYTDEFEWDAGTIEWVGDWSTRLLTAIEGG